VFPMANNAKEFARGLLDYQGEANDVAGKEKEALDDLDIDVTNMSTDELIALLRGL